MTQLPHLGRAEVCGLLEGSLREWHSVGKPGAEWACRTRSLEASAKSRPVKKKKDASLGTETWLQPF